MHERLSKPFETILHLFVKSPPDNGKSKSFATTTEVNGRIKSCAGKITTEIHVRLKLDIY